MDASPKSLGSARLYRAIREKNSAFVSLWMLRANTDLNKQQQPFNGKKIADAWKFNPDPVTLSAIFEYLPYRKYTRWVGRRDDKPFLDFVMHKIIFEIKNLKDEDTNKINLYSECVKIILEFYPEDRLHSSGLSSHLVDAVKNGYSWPFGYLLFSKTLSQQLLINKIEYDWYLDKFGRFTQEDIDKYFYTLSILYQRNCWGELDQLLDQQGFELFVHHSNFTSDISVIRKNIAIANEFAKRGIDVLKP